MGMDFYKFEIKGVNVSEDLPDFFHVDDINKMWDMGVLCLKNTSRFQAWFDKSGFSSLKVRKMYSIDWDKFINSPEINKGCDNIVDYNDGANKEFNFIQTEDKNTGETFLFGKEDIPYLEEDYVFLDFKEIGYMRRPFSGDFSIQGYEALKKISHLEYEEANMYFYTLEELNSLKPFTNSQKLFASLYEDFNEKFIFHVNW